MIVYVVTGFNDETSWSVRGYLTEAAAEAEATRLNQEVEAWKKAQDVWVKRLEEAVPWTGLTAAGRQALAREVLTKRTAWVTQNPPPERPMSGDETVSYRVETLEVIE